MPRAEGLRIALRAVLLFPFLSAVAADSISGRPAFAEGPGMGEVRGLVKPHNEAVISSQIGGRVVELPYRPGDAFGAGDLLIAFDCAMYRARRAAAAAELAARDATHQNNLELERLGAVAHLEVAISAATVEKARAELEIAQVQVSRCEIRAPYAGRVVATVVHAHETVAANQELLRILEAGNLEIELVVPSQWLTWLERDADLGFRVDETGREYAARISQIGASADPVSQTVRLQAVFRNDSSDVVAGMSGTAEFALPAAPAAPAARAD